MTFNSRKHHRRSIRLKGYDYTQPGWYFITICTDHRCFLFGEIVSAKMILNPFGKIAKEEWIKSAKLRKNIHLDKFIVMPNHFHGIIGIIEEGNCKGTARRTPTIEQFGKPVSGSIPTIIRSYKSAVTKRINELRISPGSQVWQRNYYEHVIRDESDLNRIRNYILENPLKWQDDKYYQ